MLFMSDRMIIVLSLDGMSASLDRYSCSLCHPGLPIGGLEANVTAFSKV